MIIGSCQMLAKCYLKVRQFWPSDVIQKWKKININLAFVLRVCVSSIENMAHIFIFFFHCIPIKRNCSSSQRMLAQLLHRGYMYIVFRCTHVLHNNRFLPLFQIFNKFEVIPTFIAKPQNKGNEQQKLYLPPC